MSGLTILLILGMIVAIMIFAGTVNNEFSLALALAGIPSLMLILCIGWKMASPYWVPVTIGAIIVGLISIMGD